MAQTSYTSGPWVLGGCSGRMITTPDGYVGNGFIADVDTLANARLIAAAPELLEALQDMVALVKSRAYPQPDKPSSDWGRAEAAEDIILKALGETK